VTTSSPQSSEGSASAVLPARDVERYAAFISYSHALDGTLAPALQTSLEQFGRVWYRRRALRLFRDTTNLAATPHLWNSIERALGSSSWFILLASPDSARSMWVRREIDWWLANRSAARLIVAVTGGSLAWDEATGQVDEQHTDALPPAFVERGLPEPLWVDFRPLRAAEPTDPAYQAAVVNIAAALHGIPKDDLVGEQIRQHRKRRRSIALAAMMLVFLTVTSIIAAGVAIAQRNRAVEQTRLATSRLLLPQAEGLIAENPRTALRLAEAALAIHPDPETRSGLAQLLTGTRYAGTISESLVKAHLALRADGRLLAAGDADGTITFWNLADPRHPAQVGKPLAHAEPIVAMGFSSDGRHLLSAGYQGTIDAWDLTDPARPVRAAAPLTTSAPLTSMAIGPGVMASSSSTGSTGAVTVWDVTDFARARPVGDPLVIDADGVYSLAIAPDRPLLAVRTNEAVLLWDLTNPARPRPAGTLQNRQPGSSLNPVAFNRAGTMLAVADAGVVLWDVTDPAAASPVKTLQPGEGTTLSDTTAVAFAAEKPLLAVGGIDGAVTVWDIRDPRRPDRIDPTFTGHTSALTSLAFLPGSGTLVSSESFSSIMLWDVVGTALPRPHHPGTTSAGEPTSAVAITPDGQYAASGSNDGSVSSWDLADPARPHRLGAAVPGHSGAANSPPLGTPYASMAFSPDGQTLATGGEDGAVALWDASHPGHLRRLDTTLVGHEGPITSVRFAPVGTILATGSLDGTVRLWNIANPARPEAIGPPLADPFTSGFVSSVAFSRDARTLAAGGGRGAILWDVTDPAHARRVGPPLTEHTDTVNAVAFSPAADLLVTGSKDDTAILWDVTDKTQPRAIGQPLEPGTVSVSSVAIARDGHTLVTGGIYYAAVVWDLSSLDRPRKLGPTLKRERMSGWATAIASDRALVTSSVDGAVVVWDLRELNALRADPLARACLITGGGLKRDEWARYVPTLAYDDTCTR
jgi:WD40 repeat protein